MTLLNRLFPPHHPPSPREELQLDDVIDEAERKRDEAEAAIKRWAPEVHRRQRLAQVMREAQQQRERSNGRQER